MKRGNMFESSSSEEDSIDLGEDEDKKKEAEELPIGFVVESKRKM